VAKDRDRGGHRKADDHAGQEGRPADGSDRLQEPSRRRTGFLAHRSDRGEGEPSEHHRADVGEPLDLEALDAARAAGRFLRGPLEALIALAQTSEIGKIARCGEF
jgi:hypothetical protein